MNYFKKRRIIKTAQEVIHQGMYLINMREDIMSESDVSRLKDLEKKLLVALKDKNIKEIKNISENLYEQINHLYPKRSYSALRENLEIFVVSVVVAMAFRAYFIQPFKIPTGSMQPSLYGITSKAYDKPSLFDYMPLKLAKWFIKGTWYRNVEVKKGSKIKGFSGNNPYNPADVYLIIGDKQYKIPKDAIRRQELEPRTAYEYIPKGTKLWSGMISAGDHLFVNKISWNFRRPRRGEVIVFRTDNIQTLPKGIHYIKRLIGLPEEKVSIDSPYVLINGKKVISPDAISRIARKETGYAGYLAAGYLSSPDQFIQIDKGEYFALGDNTTNSRDGRYWGTIPERNLVGPALVVYWPFSKRWGRIK